MKVQLFFSIVIIIFSSCTTTDIFRSKEHLSEVRDMVVFEPLSYISLINKGNNLMLSDSLSEISKRLWLNLVEQNKYCLPIEGYYISEDYFNNDQLQEEIWSLFDEVGSLDKFFSIPLPPTLKSQLDLLETRYGMLTVTSGFTRRKGNLRGQMLKSTGIGLLTMGMVMDIPATAQSIVDVMIVDKERDEVIFYKSSTMKDFQPLKKKTLERHLNDLFEDYFW